FVAGTVWLIYFASIYDYLIGGLVFPSNQAHNLSIAAFFILAALVIPLSFGRCRQGTERKYKTPLRAVCFGALVVCLFIGFVTMPIIGQPRSSGLPLFELRDKYLVLHRLGDIEVPRGEFLKLS